MSVLLSPKTNLKWPDYAFITFVLALCVAISLYFKRKNTTKSQDVHGGGKLSEFLLATRSLSVLPVALSISATIISPISLTALTADFYTYGVQYGVVFISVTFGMIIVALFVVPLYRKFRSISVFQLLEERFDGCIRRIFSLIFILNKLCTMALVLYLPVISLTTLTPFNTQIITFVLGFICTCYSSVGGFRTVVWTDAIQLVLIMVATSMVIIQGTIKIGSMGDVWKNSMENGFLTAISLSEGEGIRCSIWAMIAHGLVFSADCFLINQATMQRVLAVKSNVAARFSVILAAFFISLNSIAIVLIGAILYILYGQCDPVTFTKYTGVSRIDQMFVYAIGNLFFDYPILKGVAISGIISASLSTFSSYINAFAALALEDFIKPMFPNFTRSDSVSVKICMGLSFAFGALATFASLLMPLMGNVVKAFSIIGGVLRGPLSGIAILVLFYKKLTKKACFFGMITSMLLVSWLIIGHEIYAKKSKEATLIHSRDDCDSEYLITSPNVNITIAVEDNQSLVMSLYKISYMWYTSIGFTAALIMGVIFSEISNSFQRRKKVYLQVKNGVEDAKERASDTVELPILRA